MLKQSLLKNKRAVAGILLTLLLLCVMLLFQYGTNKSAVKIGILHSLTGTMVISEKPLVDALQFAIEEVNAKGGINGRQIEAVIRDCRSDAVYCAQQAEQLIVREKVSVLFGCWTSSCRKAVKSVVEKHNHLLFYPVQYEGMEQSPNIIYTGAAPNQQIIPAVHWALEKFGKRVYLAGSDYVFPRMANIIIKDMLTANNAIAVGERYLPLGSSSMNGLVADILRQRPAVVFNTFNGGSNFAFFAALNKAGIRADEIPVMSFSLAEAELASLGTLDMAGHYAAWNYFQSLPTAQNQDFVARFRQRFGAQVVLDDPMEACYIGVMLWAQAARETGSFAPAVVRQSVLRQTLHAPEGVVAVDAETGHLWKTPMIGKIREDGQFDIVWDAGMAVEPQPFPNYRFQDEWYKLLNSAQQGGKP
jgi:urea transport system substrate-binding protein